MPAKLITGPTFAEMLDPSKIQPNIREKALQAKDADPLDPINLFNISWKSGHNEICYEVRCRQVKNVSNLQWR